MITEPRPPVTSPEAGLRIRTNFPRFQYDFLLVVEVTCRPPPAPLRDEAEEATSGGARLLVSCRFSRDLRLRGGQESTKGSRGSVSSTFQVNEFFSEDGYFDDEKFESEVKKVVASFEGKKRN